MNIRILRWSITAAFAGFLFGFDTVVVSGAEQRTDFAPGYVSAFFAGMMLLQLVWVKCMVIETKGESLERIQERLKVAA